MMSIFFALITINLYATCPICIAGVLGSFWLNQKLGIGDLFFAFWLGAISFSFFIYVAKFLHKKINIYLSYFFSFILNFPPLLTPYYNNQIIYNLHLKHGLDEYLFGLLFGLFFAFLGNLVYKIIYKLNNNKPHFNYQKVVIYFISILIGLLILNIL